MTATITCKRGLYEVHASTAWEDLITGRMTSYLAGFLTRARAENWCRDHGYEVA